MTMTRSADREFRAAFDEANTYARAIANHVVAGVDMTPGLVDAYTRARGHLDRVVELMGGAAAIELDALDGELAV